VCVKDKASSGTPTEPIAPPGPTQPGIVEGCRKYYYHLVKSGEGCSGIQQEYGIPHYATFVKWNPALGSDCQNL
ncbi:hypothetical protein LX32DRAFT_588044, partial [Colletotrichum zoysiae]